MLDDDGRAMNGEPIEDNTIVEFNFDLTDKMEAMRANRQDRDDLSNKEVVYRVRRTIGYRSGRVASIQYPVTRRC
jgi:hypothetical protein